MDGRGGLLSAGGILSIIVGAFELISGAALAALFAIGLRPFEFPGFPFFGFPFRGGFGANLTIVIIIGAVLAVLGVIAIVGGTSAVRRGSFGLSLAGAICALPSGTLGILAVIFISLAKGEFRAE